MKNLIFILTFLVTFAANAQFKTTPSVVETAGIHTINSYKYSTKYMLETTEYAVSELDKYETKMIIGGVSYALSAASFAVASHIRTPIYGNGNDAQAKLLHNERTIFKGIGVVWAAIGTIYIIDAQKHRRRATLTLTNNGARVSFRLYGK